MVSTLLVSLSEKHHKNLSKEGISLLKKACQAPIEIPLEPFESEPDLAGV